MGEYLTTRSDLYRSKSCLSFRCENMTEKLLQTSLLGAGIVQLILEDILVIAMLIFPLAFLTLVSKKCYVSTLKVRRRLGYNSNFQTKWLRFVKVYAHVLVFSSIVATQPGLEWGFALRLPYDD